MKKYVISVNNVCSRTVRYLDESEVENIDEIVEKNSEGVVIDDNRRKF